MSTPILWLIAGALMLALEALGIPGIGFLFAGLAAILVGTAVQSGIIGMEAYIAQIALWFTLTAIFAALLWKKLKNWHTAKTQGNYQNMIGDAATIALSGLQKGAVGQVRWSGTLMSAELDPSESAHGLSEGTRVIITAVKGNVLVVKSGG